MFFAKGWNSSRSPTPTTVKGALIFIASSCFWSGLIGMPGVPSPGTLGAPYPTLVATCAHASPTANTAMHNAMDILLVIFLSCQNNSLLTAAPATATSGPEQRANVCSDRYRCRGWHTNYPHAVL